MRTSRARGRAGLDARLRVWQRSERLCDVADRVRQLTSSLSNPGGRTFKRSNHGNRHFSRQYTSHDEACAIQLHERPYPPSRVDF